MAKMEMARERIREDSIRQAFVPPARILLDIQQEFKPDVMAGLPRADVIYTYIKRYRRPVGNKEPTDRSQIRLTYNQTHT